MQFKCSLQKDADHLLDHNKEIAMFIILESMLIAVLWSSSIFYWRKTGALNMKQWDLNTVTSGDFTIQIDFSMELWNTWTEYINSKDKKSMTSEELSELHFK